MNLGVLMHKWVFESKLKKKKLSVQKK